MKPPDFLPIKRRPNLEDLSSGLATMWRESKTDQFIWATAQLEEVTSLSRKELAEIDTRLVASVHYYGQLQDKKFSARLLQKSATYWNNPRPIEMDDFITDITLSKFVLDSVIAVSDIDTISKTLRPMCVTSAISQINETSVVTQYAIISPEVSFAWFDQHFPGCVHKAIHASALGLTQSDVVAHAFYQDNSHFFQPLAKPQLPPLTV